MPELSEEEALEITKIYNITGHLCEMGSLITERPFSRGRNTCQGVDI
jgi:Predicted ATPase with chaperone activity